MKTPNNVVVTGPCRVFGRKPGDEFDPEDIPQEQLERLIARGSLQWASPAAPASTAPTTPSAPEAPDTEE